MKYFKHNDLKDLRHDIYDVMASSIAAGKKVWSIVGVTGKSGSGKSTLCRELAESLHEFISTPVIVINVDEIGHIALNDKRNELVSAFGFDVVSNRQKLGDLIFNNRHDMIKLTDIIWNRMQELIDAKINSAPDRGVVILDWILLPHAKKYWDMCSIKVLVDTPIDVRKARVLMRDHISEEQFMLRERNSIEYNKLEFTKIW